MRVTTTILTILLSVQVAVAQRIEQTINDAWRFALEGQKSTIVDIPHTWNAEDCCDDERGYHRGKGIYERTLRITESPAERCFTLLFEGAYQVTTLYVNGKSAGSHNGGYTAFSFDITELVKQGDNHLRVCVNSSHNKDIPPLSADFTFFGGIYRDVVLISTPRQQISTTHYATSGVYLTPEPISEKQGKLRITTRLNNRSAERATLQLTHTVIAPDGSTAKVVRERVILAPQSLNAEIVSTLMLDTPQLWDVEHPNLYTVRTSLHNRQGALLDEVLNRCGFRTFEFDTERGFRLNGRHLKLWGTNRHQDYLAKGNAIGDARNEADVRSLKELGGNFLRVSHYPQDHIVTTMCDRLGILSSVEIPIVNAITPGDEFLNNSLNMLREMVYQDYNSPSVIIWAYMNEVLLRLPHKQKKEPALYKSYIDALYKLSATIESTLRELDPTRRTMIVCHRNMDLYESSGLLGLPHIIGWNLYQGWYTGELDDFGVFLKEAHDRYPDKAMMVTEYGADMDIRLHSQNPLRMDYTCEYGIRFHHHFLAEIAKHDFVAGGVMWNLNDFYSEARMDGMPHINNKGLADLAREKKDVWHLHRAVYDHTPFVEIGGKGWQNRGGATVNGICRQKVHVFSNGSHVELFCGDKSLGTKPIEGGMAIFEVPFVDGENRLSAHAKAGTATVCDHATLHFKGYPEIIDRDFESLNVILGTSRSFDDRTEAIAWIAEKPYSAGSWGYIGGEIQYPRGSKSKRPAMTLDVPGTDRDPLWQTQRVDIEAFKADVPDGRYYVYLYMCEWDSTMKREALANDLGASNDTTSTVEKRIFDVAVNGQIVVPGLNLAEEIGPHRGLIRRIAVTVKEGEGLNIEFRPQQGHTILNAIRIHRLY
ncbi:MAG: beta-galactosidase [Alistipes sp.]|nr:beta-galactosidase [Alistipes sp.]